MLYLIRTPPPQQSFMRNRPSNTPWLSSGQIQNIALSITLVSLGLGASALHADTFGTGSNLFTIDFVDIGNAGNGDDVPDGGQSYGGVAYDYRISTYEITADAVTKAVNSGLINVSRTTHTNGNQPVVGVQWYEAAAMVNWMNIDAGYQAAYNLSNSGGTWSVAAWGVEDQASTGVDSGTNEFRHKDAFYFIPSEDEWYKAAFHQNNGVTSDYFAYATGSDSAPDGVDFAGDTDYDAVFKDSGYVPGAFAVTDSGTASPYGTYGQNGNVWEWNERSDGGTITGGVRGAAFGENANDMLSTNDIPAFGATSQNHVVGFRVASVPEPSTLMFALTSAGLGLSIRRRKASL